MKKIFAIALGLMLAAWAGGSAKAITLAPDYSATPASPGTSQNQSGTQNQNQTQNRDQSQNQNEIQNRDQTQAPQNQVQQAPAASSAAWPDGTLVRASNDKTVFRVHGNMLEPFTSEAVFFANGLKFADVKVVESTQLSGWKTGNFVEIPDHSLFVGTTDKTVFEFQGGKLHGIPSMDVFEKQNLAKDKVIKVKDADLEQLPKGDVFS